MIIKLGEKKAIEIDSWELGKICGLISTVLVAIASAKSDKKE